MARAIRTAGLALAIAVMGTAAVAVAGTLDPGGDQAAQPPSTKPPSTSVAVRATSTQATVPDEPRPEQLPRLASSAKPSVDGADEPEPPGLEPAAIAAVEADTATGWQQRIGEAALARLDYPWEAIGYEVHFLPGRAGFLGMTFPERRSIEIYVREGLSVDEVARNVAHELGHAYDFAFNTAATRALYKQVRGIDGAGWLACRGCTDLSTPAGDFAETFSYWLMDGEFPSRSTLGAADAAQLRSLAALFDAATGAGAR